MMSSLSTFNAKTSKDNKNSSTNTTHRNEETTVYKKICSNHIENKTGYPEIVYHDTIHDHLFSIATDESTVFFVNHEYTDFKPRKLNQAARSQKKQ